MCLRPGTCGNSCKERPQTLEGRERQDGGLVAKEIRKEEHGEGLRSSKQLAVGEAWERRLPWNLKASSLFHS